MPRYSLVMSDSRNLPPDAPLQKTAATGLEVPVPERDGFFADLGRACGRNDVGDGGGDAGKPAADQG